jgi:drug/metabolite transporter (DMT)-like permease
MTLSSRSVEPADGRQKRLAYIAWIAVCLIWGTTYLGIRVTIETMPPLLMSGLRWTIAGTVLATYLAIRGERLPSRSSWGGVALLGFLLLGVGNGGVAWAEQWVPSGLAAVIVASSPFWMASVESLRRDGERITGRVGAGLALGFCGIVLLVWPDLRAGSVGDHHFLAGIVALQLACLGWAIGSSYSRRHRRDESVFSATAGQMIAGGMMMLIVASVRGEWSGLAFSVRSATAFIYLTTIGAIGGFVAYTYALRHLPVSLVSLYAYINPIIAVALGVLLLGEPFDIRMALAAALVFAGVGIVQSRSARTLGLARTPPGASSLGRQTNARASVQKRAV